jgi:hypothetical protein
MGSLLDSVMGGAGAAAGNLTGQNLLNPNTGGFGTAGAATSLLAGGAQGAMMGILGMDPNCPAGTSGSGMSSNEDNDPCGKNNDPLAKAALGLGMSLAGPAIAEAGVALGGVLDEGLGGVSSALGDGISSAAGGIGGLFGADEDQTGSIATALGAGAGSVISGGDAKSSAANMLSAGAVANNNDNVSDASDSEKDTGLFSKIEQMF